MARWRLLKSHYLWTTHIDGTSDNEWTYEETNRDTGRRAIKRYNVPRFFNPEDPADWNTRDSGDCVVCHEGKGLPKDHIFTGPPTLDMEPLDYEAEVLTKEVQRNCKHPIDSLPGDFTQSILNDFQRQIDALAKAQPVTPVNAAVTFQEFNDLKSQVAKLLEENAKLRSKPVEIRK
jgi:hypothetical protein